MNRRVVFLINGLGLGNSTRCHSVIQALHAEGAEIQVITSGNGTWYFQDIAEISKLHAIQSLHYGSDDGKISILKTIGLAGEFIRVIRSNAAAITDVLKAFRPDIVVTDSEYTFMPMKKLGIPVASLNNADVVIESTRKFVNVPGSVKPQLYGVEYPDYLFNKFVPNLVISPTLDMSLPCRGKNVLRVGPIVRSRYVGQIYNEEATAAVIMLSGSVFGSPVVLNRDSYPVKIDVVGRPAPDGWAGHQDVVYHGKVRGTHELLAKADLAVVNGGFSAVSEVFMMRKPVVVIPVPNHAEQWVNARTIQELGVGAIGSEETLETDMLNALDRIDEFRAAYHRLPDISNGAERAASGILDIAKI